MKKLILLILLALMVPMIGVITLLRSQLDSGAGLQGFGHPVVMITVDYLRPSDITKDIMPNLWALQNRGLSFSQAYTTSPLNLPAHVSLLSGQYPYEHGVRDDYWFAVKDSTPWIPQRARQAGWQTAAAVGSGRLSPDTGLQRGFDWYDAPWPDTKSRAMFLPTQTELQNAEQVGRGAMHWMVEHHAEGSFFLWINFADLDECWIYAGMAESTAAPSQRYTLALNAIDTQIGLLLELLQGLNLADRTLLAVTAPHADARGQLGEIGSGDLLSEASIRVPMILAGPQVPKASVRTDVVSHIDLAATLMQIIPGDDIPAGRDLLAPDIENSLVATPIFFETARPNLQYGYSALFGRRMQSMKLILGVNHELYDLDADPEGRENLATRDTTLLDVQVQSLQQDLRHLELGSNFDEWVEKGALPGVLSSNRFTRFKEAKDHPRDHQDVLNGIVRIAALVGLDEWKQALQMANDLELREPDNVRVLYWLGQLRFKAGDTDRAKLAFQKIRDLGKEFPGGDMGFSDLQCHAGGWQSAELGYSSVLQDLPQFYYAQMALAECLLQRREFDKAYNAFQTAAGIQSLRPEPETKKAQCLLAQGFFESAARLCKTSIQRFPQEGILRLTLAQALIGSKEYPAAKDALLQGLKLGQTPEEFYRYLAIVYYELEVLDLSLSYADKYLSHVSQDAGMLHLKSEILRRKEEE